MKIRTLIVEDEPLGRERIRALLKDDPDVQLIADCCDGPEAVVSIEKNLPELVFLDVQMPGMDGFAVLDTISVQPMPAIIFVTAYDHYAVRAFEIHALDYLLKSFDPDRFQAALLRAKQEIRRSRDGHWNERLAGLLEDLQARKNQLKRIVVRSAGRIVFLPVGEVDWIEAADNYVHLHAGRESHLIRETLQSLAGKLDPAKFLRIHRSTIVNVDRIRELRPLFHGDYAVKLVDGSELTLSRTFREKLAQPLGQFL